MSLDRTAPGARALRPRPAGRGRRLSPSQERLLRAHREIDLLARKSLLPFVSGWETAHDIEYEHLRPERFGGLGTRKYVFMADDATLEEQVRAFHEEVDGSLADGSAVFVGAGSSPLISSLLITLSLLGQERIHYAPPIYHAYYYMARVLGLEMVCLEETVGPAEEEFAESLPAERAVLLITDPSWIHGRPVSRDLWERVRDWQDATGSLVIVDGTFQYTSWDGMKAEDSRCLDPDNTVRLVCPTKSLCIHGVRFAYLLLPTRFAEDLGYTYSKLVAGTSAFDTSVAGAMMEQLRSARNNRDLVEYVRGRYERLCEKSLLSPPAHEPSCTYYTFADVDLDLSTVLYMNSPYFELEYPDSFIRVNILAPELAELGLV